MFLAEAEGEGEVEFEVRKADFSMDGVREYHKRIQVSKVIYLYGLQMLTVANVQVCTNRHLCFGLLIGLAS